jgi:hypothetical protein
MGYTIAYLGKMYDIFPTLMVNNDQTWIHSVQTIREWTWESNRTKLIKVLGMEDKRQITIVISSIIDGLPLPFKSYLQVPQTEHCH